MSAATSSISPAGGTISITDPGSPLNGMEIKVPPASYSSATQFKVSYAPVEKHTFGPAFNPITPMITVDNGGGYSEEIMQVKIPVKVPPGNFAMGFLYDDKTGQLEGLPLVAQDASSITVATRHFSRLVFSSIREEALLNKDIESGFRPGIDDWQFTNYGSYISPGGHCAGQSIAAMWYFTARPDGEGAGLYGRYDNNGTKPATPDFWWDDSLGYRFSSVLQEDMNWDKYFYGFTYQLSANHQRTWELFVNSMQLTRSPDFVSIFSSKDKTGHALVVYKISGNKLYVADPNYPGRTDRYIEYSNGKFIPYNSGANADEIAAGKGKTYDVIAYVGITATIDWGKIGRRWAEVKSKTIGADYFPSYEMQWRDDQKNWHKLEDGFVSPKKRLDLGIFALKGIEGKNLIFYVSRNGKTLTPDASAPGLAGFYLNTGKNLLGINVTGLGAGNKERYIDFKYFNITYNETATPSDSDSEGCFIATAAYGTPEAEGINILRKFRDDFLLKNSLGKLFVDTYYALSPPIAEFISNHELVRTVVREYFVAPIVSIVESTQSSWSKDTIK